MHCQGDQAGGSLVGLSAPDVLSDEFQQLVQFGTKLHQLSDQSVRGAGGKSAFATFRDATTDNFHFSFCSVFRSCKLIPTMIVASIVHKKVFSSVEYFCAFCIW